MTRAKITQTGPNSAVVEPIVLRPGDLTRVVFKPQIVNNKQDENKPVKGHVLWQKRGKSEAGEEWADEAEEQARQAEAEAQRQRELEKQKVFFGGAAPEAAGCCTAD